jgi:hypothetical protein
MDRSIAIELAPAREIAIDGAVVARALGLEIDAFRQLMAERKVAVLCERGTGADEGLYRASFYIERRRARLVVDAEGRIVGPVAANDGVSGGAGRGGTGHARPGTLSRS